jgi:hypothetical protein
MYKYVCIYMCVYIYMCVCVYLMVLEFELKALHLLARYSTI